MCKIAPTISENNLLNGGESVVGVLEQMQLEKYHQ